MNLRNRLNKISKHLNADEETVYIFVRPESEGGTLTLYGEKGKEQWDSTIKEGSIITNNGGITVLLPHELVGTV